MSNVADGARMDAAITGVSVSYNWDRPWIDQWWVALYWADQIERCYVGRPDPPHDTNGWKLMGQQAALAICHVMDWLAHDPNVALTESQLRTIVEQSYWLQFVTDVANTLKHRTRSSPSAATAHVSSVLVQGTVGNLQCQLKVERRHANGAVEIVDARDLVQGGIREWRTVLAAHQIQDPHPNGI